MLPEQAFTRHAKLLGTEHSVLVGTDANGKENSNSAQALVQFIATLAKAEAIKED